MATPKAVLVPFSRESMISINIPFVSFFIILTTMLRPTVIRIEKNAAFIGVLPFTNI